MASLHSIISGQIPEFVKSNYPVFVEFVRAYYKWLEQQNTSFGDSTEIDVAPETFVKFFKSFFGLV